MSNSNEIIIAGRPCIISSLGRVRRKRGWGFYNLVSIRWTDNDEYWSGGAAAYVALVKKLEKEFKRKNS